MIKRMLILCCALAVSACATLSTALPILAGGPTPIAVQAVADKVVISADKALIIAHLGYESAGDVALSARKLGVINDAQWHAVQAYDNVAYSYLQKGDAAQTAAARADAAASALQAISDLKALLPANFTKGN